MITYLNTRTGRVVDVEEAVEVERKWSDAARDARTTRAAERTEARGKKLAGQVRHTIAKMDDSERWERLSDPREADRLRKTYERKSALRRGVPASLIDTDDVAVAAAATITVDDDLNSDGDGDGRDAVERPAQGDPKADWVDYHVALGMDRAEADSTNKHDLIALAE